MNLKQFLKENMTAEIRKGAVSRIVSVFAPDGLEIRRYSYNGGKFVENTSLPQVNVEKGKLLKKQADAILAEVKKVIESGKFDGNDGKPDFQLTHGGYDIKVSKNPD